MLGESLRERFGETPEVPIRHEAIKLLASDTRLNILKHLDKRRMTVSELARALGLNKSTVHEHLAKLVEGGLLRRDASEEREFVYYELTKTARYVLQPSSARFVLMMGTFLIAGLFALAILHLALTAGQGLALATHEPIAPAGESREWTVQATRPGLLGAPLPVRGATLYLLTPEEAADYHVAHALAPTSRALGPAEGLREAAPGVYAFTTALPPGVHYVLAVGPGNLPGALLPLRGEEVLVAPKAASVLRGVDPSEVEVAVTYRGAPVAEGLLEAIAPDGRALSRSSVEDGRAVVALPLQQPSDKVQFRFKPAAPGSGFAAAEGSLAAPAPRVAFEPSTLPAFVAGEVRVVVDDPLLGPRAGAPVSLVRPDGRAVAHGMTDGTGGERLQVRLTEPGELVVKAGSVEIGRVAVKPGIRAWVEPGPHAEGDRVRVRSLLLGAEPQVVQGAAVYLDGREVGVTDPEGSLHLQFGLGGRYQLELRKDGHVPGATMVDVLPATGLAPHTPGRGGFAPAPSPARPKALPPAAPAAEVEVAQRSLAWGQPTEVAAWVHNPDSLPRAVRAELREDGRVLEVHAVELAPGAGARVAFAYRPTSPGVHEVGVNALEPVLVEVLPPLPMVGAAKAVPGAPLALAGAAVGAAALVLARRKA